MHMKRFVTVLAVLSVFTGCGRETHELTLVSPAAPTDRAVAEELHELLANDQSATKLRLTATSMSDADAIEAVVSGAADLALVPNNLDYRPEIATVMPLYATVLHIAHRVEVNLATATDLAVYAGPEGSVSRSMFERIASRTGIQAENFHFTEDAGEATDIVVIFAPISPQRAAQIPGLTLASVESPEDIGQGGAIDAAVLLNPHFRPFVIPAGTYGDATPAPVVTIAVDQLLVTRSDMDPSVVYDLISTVLRLRPALASKRPGLFHQLSGNFDAGRSRFVLHPGTQNFLQREEPTVYERYSGVAEVAVTLLVACFSASVAGIRIYQRRRKNRIDEFYSRTIELQRTAAAASSSEQRLRVAGDLRKLQVEAFELLVDEKLAADESFRIFITQSNDVLQQLESDAADT